MSDRAAGGGSASDESDADARAGFVVDGVSKRYGDVTALDGVDLAVRPGQVHGLVGPNGSGKTTLFHLLSGLARPSAGTVRRPDPGRVGVGFQQPRFYPDLTVRENLSVFRSFAADPPPADWTATLLEALRLEPAAHRPGRDLSGGFRTKLDLALAMLKRPDFLLLDEPLSDVDDHSRARIVSFLGEYCTEDRSIVVSTHNVESFDDVLDRVTVLVDGEIEYDGPAQADALDRYRDVLEADPVER
ncbi:ABC transporter ATP-binding protein [Natronomonas salina]|uniref:ABC transporter ATP-binding protein n=1 Tax=Natronomonas salina TaxID=1710540 RepID=UPI0015B4EB6B|nr:ABC transporter ATP-binding protein [Natronomonas salina]QLD88890.1 ABC transporter ATP-binding protein [Natronomonas salina]